MKIIDAHLHFSTMEQYFFDIAKKSRHENSAKHLKNLGNSFFLSANRVYDLKF